jgi:predicted Zn-dependent protease
MPFKKHIVHLLTTIMMTQALLIRKTALSLFFLITFMVMMIHPFCAKAQNIIRDSEIESYMAQWFEPIFTANNMSPDQVKIILVQDDKINAFVAGGANIFFYTGLIEKTDNPGELIGVMAHELGHISGGHLVRGREALEQASYENILGTILSIGAAVASGDSSAVVAGSAASNSVAQRRFLAKTRTFESSADQAAIQSMVRANMNPKGLLTFMQKLQGQELLPASQQSEYIRSHPLTQNRIEAIKTRVQESPLANKSFPAEWADQHARMKAKLLGYIHPEQVEWGYDVTDQSIPVRYARAVAAYRQNKIDNALKEINALIANEPNNPYFHELKGQMLVEFGRVADGIKPLATAVQLRPQDGLLRTALAHAQIETTGRDASQLTQAVEHLKIAQRAEPRSTRVHRLLATAYGRQGKEGYAKLHLAEEAVLQNKISYAKKQARAALQTLPNGSVASQRANDILLHDTKNQ